MLSWFKTSKVIPVPTAVENEIFQMARADCNDAQLNTLKFYINTYSMNQIDNLWRSGLNPLMLSMDNMDEPISGVKFAQLMFASGSDISKKSPFGFSVLLGATKNKAHSNILRACLVNGGDPNELMGNSEMGFVNTALGLAVTFNNLDAVKLLVAFKADGAGLSNNALNCWANSCHHIDRPKTKKLDEFFLIKKAILKQLLMAGADINALSRNRYGGGEIQTPIETCSTYGKAGDPVTDKLIEMLLEHGADASHLG